MKIVLSILYRLAVNAIGLGVAGLLFKHVNIGSFGTLLLAAFVLTVCNFFIKPILTFISLPFLIFTLGLFYFVINGLVILLVSWAVAAFAVDGLWTAIGVSIVVGLVNLLFDAFNDRDIKIKAYYQD